eukprot:scaffold302_cov397-Prasinococcus_capsulatus_cf.AAC.14
MVQMPSLRRISAPLPSGSCAACTSVPRRTAMVAGGGPRVAVPPPREYSVPPNREYAPRRVARETLRARNPSRHAGRPANMLGRAGGGR